jgi:hypothetical protein
VSNDKQFVFCFGKIVPGAFSPVLANHRKFVVPQQTASRDRRPKFSLVPNVDKRSLEKAA